MAAATVSRRKTRSVWVRAILRAFNRKSWTGVADLYRAAAMSVPVAQALKVYKKRINAGDPKAVKIKRGRAMQLMLSTITLVQHGKIEQRGRGETKEFRLL